MSHNTFPADYGVTVEHVVLLLYQCRQEVVKYLIIIISYQSNAYKYLVFFLGIFYEVENIQIWLNKYTIKIT